jgi:hypothetical protein
LYNLTLSNQFSDTTSFSKEVLVEVFAFAYIQVQSISYLRHKISKKIAIKNSSTARLLKIKTLERKSYK